MDDPTAPRCNFEATFELLGQKHVLSILRQLNDGRPKRFSELRNRLEINPKTLTERLGALEREGLIFRREYAEIPRRVEYGLTAMGEDLGGIFEALQAWRRKYTPAVQVAVR